MADIRQIGILEAAISVLSKVGTVATMSDIAKEAGVPEATMYRVYYSRDSIVLDIYDMFWRKIGEEINAVQASIPSEYRSVEKIIQMINALRLFLFKKSDLIAAIQRNPLPLPEDLKQGKNPEREQELIDKRIEIREKHRNVLRLIDLIIKEGQDQGDIINDLTPQIIRQLLMGSFMLLSYGLLQFDKEKERDVRYSTIDAEKGIQFLLKAFSTVKETGGKSV